MNPRTITLQAPIHIPEIDSALAGDQCFLHVFATDAGFVLRWVDVAECPIYIRTKTGQKARLAMSLTSSISQLPKHGKVVLVFEELLACEDGKTIYNTWKTEEWFPYLAE